ncbi:hypothetical protein [Novosphingobium sp.]|uniref:hypothetical protein n=1 Tax=Novosphingobium sp. TaxID=1874826 RepID=UPI0031D8525C
MHILEESRHILRSGIHIGVLKPGNGDFTRQFDQACGDLGIILGHIISSSCDGTKAYASPRTQSNIDQEEAPPVPRRDWRRRDFHLAQQYVKIPSIDAIRR